MLEKAQEALTDMRHRLTQEADLNVLRAPQDIISLKLAIRVNKRFAHKEPMELAEALLKVLEAEKTLRNEINTAARGINRETLMEMTFEEWSSQKNKSKDIKLLRALESRSRIY